MILVTGATGNVGREVVAGLAHAQVPVRAMSRDPAKARMPAGVEVVAGDLMDPSSLEAALRGVDGMFLFPPLRGVDAVVAAVRGSKLRRLVLLSSSAVVGAENGNVLAESHRRVEAAIEALPVAWTFVRPGGFATNALAWAESIRTEGVVRGPYPESTSAPIDPRDIAAVAIRALIDPGHQGAKHVLSGPESLTQAEQVRQIGAALGRELRFETVSVEAAKAHLGARMPPPYIEALFALQARSVNVPAALSPSVRAITGREPRAFAEWARDHAGAFR